MIPLSGIDVERFQQIVTEILPPVTIEPVEVQDRHLERAHTMIFTAGLNTRGGSTAGDSTLDDLIYCCKYIVENIDAFNTPGTFTALDAYIPGYTWDEFCDKLTAPWSEIYGGDFFCTEDCQTQDSNDMPKTIMDFIIMMNWSGYRDYENKFLYKTGQYTLIKRALGIIAIFRGVNLFIALNIRSKGVIWSQIYNYDLKIPLTYRIDQPSTWLSYSISDNDLFNIGSLLGDYDNTLAIEPFLGMQITEEAMKIAKWMTAVNTIPFMKIGSLKFYTIFGNQYAAGTQLGIDDGYIDLSWDVTKTISGKASDITWLQWIDVMRKFPIVIEYLKVKKYFELPKPTLIQLSKDELFSTYSNETLSKLHHALIQQYYYLTWADSQNKGSFLLDWVDSSPTNPFLEITDRQQLPYILVDCLDGVNEEDLKKMISILYCLYFPDNDGSQKGTGWLLLRGDYTNTDTNVKISPFKISMKYTEIDSPEYLGWNQIQDTTDEDMISFLYFRYKNLNMNQSLLELTWNDAATGTLGDTFHLWSQPKNDITIFTDPFTAPSVKSLELNIPKTGWVRPYKIDRTVLNPLRVLYDLNNLQSLISAPSSGGSSEIKDETKHEVDKNESGDTDRDVKEEELE